MTAAAERLTVERLGHLGDGIARGPSGPVFVPRVLPGEVVEGLITGDRMPDPKITAPSADRVRPPCAHYRTCGGCSLQHASDVFVAGWKAGVVAQALAGQGISVPVLPTVTSPAHSRRRAVLSGRRTKKGVLVGFHARASDTVVDIAGCHLLRPEIMALVPELGRVIEAGGARRSELSMMLTVTAGGIDFAVTNGKPLDSALFEELSAFAGAMNLARITWNGEPVAARLPAAQNFGGAVVVPPAGAFLQATREGESALVQAVLANIGDAKRVADLFSGAGTFSLPIARKSEVYAAEGDAALLAALDAGWRGARGLRRVTTEARDLFRRPLLREELDSFDAVVIDPPRAGCEAQVHEIAASKVPVVAAVSCNPVTFARDMAILVAAGYRLDRVLPVDQFRWSPHVEVVARLTR